MTKDANECCKPNNRVLGGSSIASAAEDLAFNAAVMPPCNVTGSSSNWSIFHGRKEGLASGDGLRVLRYEQYYPYSM